MSALNHFDCNQVNGELFWIPSSPSQHMFMCFRLVGSLLFSLVFLNFLGTDCSYCSFLDPAICPYVSWSVVLQAAVIFYFLSLCLYEWSRKCRLWLYSCSRFSVQTHWGFSIAVLIQISLLFTITCNTTIACRKGAMTPCQDSDICILAIYVDALLLLPWNV